MAGTTGAKQISTLERWEAAGAHWRVAHRSADGVTVALCRCDGGEEVDRLVSDAPELLDFLAGRESSTD